MLLLELFETETKHITFCFGRMNPPTIGHKQVFDTMKSQGGEMKIFVSQSQDKKKNPLDYSTKIKFIKAMFPEYAKDVVENAALNTIGKVASYLHEQGYNSVTFVAGSDRLEDMKNLLNQYNGVEGKAHGFYKFDVIDFESSGDREDGAEGVAGVSASGARSAAANDDLETFRDATGAGELAKPLFAAVRKGMGINESVISELKIRPGQTFDEEYKGWNLRYQIKPAQGSKEFKGRADHKQSKQTKQIGPLSADSKEEIVQKLKDAIDTSRGSNQIPTNGNVTIFFNSTLARDVIGHGGVIYADIATQGDTPVLLLSAENQGGMYRATDRSPMHQRDKEGHIGQQAFVMPAKEAVKNGLTLARYALGKAEVDYMPGITAVPLEFRNEVYPGEVVRMNEPGLTVSPPRKGQTIGEAPIEMDPSDPMDPMIVGHDKANPAKLKYRMLRAAGQLKDLAGRAEKASPSEWQTMARQFEELKMNMEQIRHALEELGKLRKKGGTRSRGIDSMLDSIEENYMKAKDIIPASKPRNFVAKNQKTAGAGAHKDKKRAEKQGDVKHKQKQFERGVEEANLKDYAEAGVCPICLGEMVSEAQLEEGKKDACYHKIKASSKVWPSAYASGRLVQCRKAGAANYGKGKKK